MALDIVAKYDGKFLARGAKTITLKGKEDTKRIVVLKFPILKKAKEFFDSN